MSAVTEGARYSPVSVGADGAARVELAADHPGLRDEHYRARRNALAALALAWSPGQPVPHPDYLEDEHRVWAVVSEQLGPLHERLAAEEFLVGKDALSLPVDHVPQLDEVSAALARRGFTYQPVAGLAPLREFYGSFARRVFWSTQYLRHPSVPLYTPEPDLIHEVIGHANQLAHPMFAELYQLFGDAVERTTAEVGLHLLSQVFWYTMEFGVAWQGRELRAYGAGILSSVGETETFARAEIRPADLAAMGHATYDITHYQPVLYAWSSMSEMHDRLASWLTGFDEAQFVGSVRGSAGLPAAWRHVGTEA
jgi:phenylalanine-4-hydroxylase